MNTHYFTVFAEPPTNLAEISSNELGPSKTINETPPCSTPFSKQLLLEKEVSTESYNGNPAGVRLVETLPTIEEHQALLTSDITYPDITMVYIKAITERHFAIRWFNRNNAIQRCGHGTLAAAAYIHDYRNNSDNSKIHYQFSSDKETLEVSANENRYSITFPIADLHTSQALSIPNQKKINDHACSMSQTQEDNGYLIIEFSNSEQVKLFECNQNFIEYIGQRALIITAKSYLLNSDITFRYFAPQYGQIEDSATGSAGSVLWPFWKKRLGTTHKSILRCAQLSKAGGYLELTQKNKKEVVVSGHVKRLKE